jgi:hypothetical protein
MSELSESTLVLSTWNIAANNQANRIGPIAEYLAIQGSGITVITELTAVRGLEQALTRELGSAYSFASIDTGGTRYEDGLGLLLTGHGYEMLDEVEAVPTHGDKMRYIMRAQLATPLGEACVIGMRGAYVAGKGTLLSTGAAERKAQFQVVADAARDSESISFISGDTNSFVRTHDRIFTRNGFHRLSGKAMTWPDKQGLKVTTLDSRIMAAPHTLTGKGIALDAIYGSQEATSVDTRVDSTGISDHMHVRVIVAKAADL